MWQSFNLLLIPAWVSVGVDRENYNWAQSLFDDITLLKRSKGSKIGKTTQLKIINKH